MPSRTTTLPTEVLLTIFALQPDVHTFLSYRLVCRFWNVLQLENDALLWKHRVLPYLPNSIHPSSIERAAYGHSESLYVEPFLDRFLRVYEGGKWKALYRLWDAYERRLGVVMQRMTSEALDKAQGVQLGKARKVHGLIENPDGANTRRSFVGAWVRAGNTLSHSVVHSVTLVGSRLFLTMKGNVPQTELFGMMDLMKDSAASQRKSETVSEYDGLFTPSTHALPDDDINLNIKGATLNHHPHSEAPSYVCVGEYYEDNLMRRSFQCNSIWSADTGDLITRFPERFHTHTIAFHKDLLIVLLPRNLLKAYRISDIRTNGGIDHAPCIWSHAIRPTGHSSLRNVLMNINTSSLHISNNVLIAHIISDRKHEDIFLFNPTTGTLLGHIPKSSWEVLSTFD
ncbi:hypothetical protein HK102_002424, partial [Quaeritorhiza haematococci]